MMEYYIVYKPYGMLSQFTQESPGQSTLADLDFAFPKDVYPVGRLDADSEGLLLLTNDRALNARLLNPQFKHPRTYYVQVEGLPTERALEQLSQGVEIKIEGKVYKTMPAKARLLASPPILPERNPPIRVRKSIPDTWVEIVLTEGKNRQVRRMCAAVGFPVLRLVRVKINHIGLWEHGLGEMFSGEIKKIENFFEK